MLLNISRMHIYHSEFGYVAGGKEYTQLKKEAPWIGQTAQLTQRQQGGISVKQQ